MKTTQRERKDPRIQTIGPTILPSQGIEVRHEGTLVILKIGNAELKMDYPTAFTISDMLRGHGKQAKKFNGDARRHWGGFSVMTDAEENARRNF